MSKTKKIILKNKNVERYIFFIVKKAHVYFII